MNTSLLQGLQAQLDAKAPQRFLLKEVLKTEEKVQGGRKRLVHTLRVTDVALGQDIVMTDKGILRALTQDPLTTFAPHFASLLSQYQYKLSVLGLDSKYSILDHVSTEDRIYVGTKRTTTEKVHRFLFRDVPRNIDFECDWDSFRRLVTDDPSHEFLPTTTESRLRQYQEQVDLLAPGKFELLAATGPYQFRVLDKSTGTIISPTIHWLLTELRTNPTKSIPCALRVEGKTLPSIAQTTGYSLSHLYALHSYKVDLSILQLENKGSSLERPIVAWLRKQNEDVVFDKKLAGTSYKPDIFLPAHNLVIECDGLYWHSDRTLHKEYHASKKKAYAALGVRSLFFREDELVYKPDIVRAVISNSLGKNQRVFGRKTTVISTSPDFFDANHLMGKGRGECLGLQYQGNLVAAIQVRWMNKKTNTLEVSRFCTLNGVSVVGGFSKLVSAVLSKYTPKTLVTYIDRRYGDGSYLTSLGWKFVRCSTSFVWTDYKRVFHRMKYPGNTGLDNGLVRVWDCGQARWELTP